MIILPTHTTFIQILYNCTHVVWLDFSPTLNQWYYSPHKNKNSPPLSAVGPPQKTSLSNNPSLLNGNPTSMHEPPPLVIDILLKTSFQQYYLFLESLIYSYVSRSGYLSSLDGSFLQHINIFSLKMHKQ